MSEQQTLIDEMEQEPEEDEEEGEAEDNHNKTNTCAAAASRKERRKAVKKEKRKKKRKEMADMARREEEARLNDPEEQLRLQAEEEQEKMRVEKERREFEERERKILEEWERRRAQEQMEEEERKRRAQEEEHQYKQNQVGFENEVDEDGWEYVEEGPPEIIWQGNEIIVKKKKVRVKKQEAGEQIAKEDPNRPTSNPLPPQSEAFADYKNTRSLSAQQLLQSVAQETPNFGTEQDKAHCPFHLKTGACRFGSRCSRIHFYPDKSCTLLIKNMYGGPGLAWEQDEGLEYTDEEVERAYEEFYEDVHTEFLKFGEIVNFKVCRNGSSHLRGNVYVHYKSLDSAVLAYQSANGRYFAGKQIQCEFIGVTRWKVAICGEFMKTKLQTCSRGTACNFIHCFRNPGGDYEWADWDKPPPRYWLKKMTALFGFSDDSGYDKHIERGSPRSFRNSSRISPDDADRYHSRRSQSRDIDYARSSRNYSEDHVRSNSHGRRSKIADRKHPEDPDVKQYNDTSNFREKPHRNDVSFDSDSDRKRLDKNMDRHSSSNRSQTHRKRKLDTRGGKNNENDPDESKYNSDRDKKLAGSTYERHLIGDWSDGERDSDHIHTEKSTKSNCSEEFEDRKSKRHSARKRKDSRTRSHMGKENETAGDDSGDHSSYGRSYRYSDSGSGYYSAKDSRKLEMDESEKQLPSHFKKSKGKRESNNKSDSESRIQHHEEKISRAADCRIVEVTEVRDRWEPEKGDSAEFD